MTWNWQLPEWPEFTFDPAKIRDSEDKFLHGSGLILGAFSHLGADDVARIRVELVSDEALETSKIEGEMLDRDSLQSSVRREFGLTTDSRRISPAEQGVSEVLVDAYQNFQPDLTVERLCSWQAKLMRGRYGVKNVGRLRTSDSPMQIVSGPLHDPKVHYEAPPSKALHDEMARYLAWFNASRHTLPALTRSAIAHLYFESIHPFEDGNGRVGRAIAELSLSQSLGKPILIALSQAIGANKRAYYDGLGSASTSLEITGWISYFAETIIEAQERAERQIRFLIDKAKFFDRYRGRLNSRQEKVLLRVFAEGPAGFVGGLSASNYASIAKTSTATVTRDLHELVDLGALIRTGERKHTRYCLNLGEPS